MNERSSAKIVLTILVLAGVVCLGAINIRALLGDSLLRTGTFEFLPNIEPIVERNVYHLIALTSIVTTAGYLIVFASSILYLILTRRRMKEDGWLLMCAILFFLFTPAEFFTMKLDWDFLWCDMKNSLSLIEFRELFIRRVAALRGVPVIALLSYYTIIVIAVWQPLKKTRREQ